MSDHNDKTTSTAGPDCEAFAKQQPHEEHPIPTDLKQPTNGRVMMVVGIFVGVLLLLFVIGLLPRLHRERQTQADAEKRADQKPIVDVVLPKAAKANQELVLPGDVKPFQETAVFPRASGYLKTLMVDINDKVEAGELLAEIDAPEVDAQLA